MKIYTYPAEESKCRICRIYQFLHLGLDHSLVHKDSCEQYIPSDNLEYLEWKLEKKEKEKNIV